MYVIVMNIGNYLKHLLNYNIVHLQNKCDLHSISNNSSITFNKDNAALPSIKISVLKYPLYYSAFIIPQNRYG